METLSAARVFELGPNQAVTGVEMQLPAPLPTRTVQIRTHWADGTPAEGTSVWVLPAGQVAVPGTSQTSSQEGNVATLTLIEEDAYSIGAQWVSTEKGKEMRVVQSHPVLLPAGKQTTVTIRLDQNRPE